MPRSVVKGWATLKDWDAHRSDIASLYIDQKKTLKEVMEIMQRDHNFLATRRMYKTRLEQWGLRKSVTARDLPEMLQQMQQMQQIQQMQQVEKGKPLASTVYLVRGREITSKRVNDYLRRYPRIAPASKKFVPANQQRSVSAPRSLSSPEDIRWPEEVMRLLGRFIAGSCEGGSWCPDGTTQPVFVARPSGLSWLDETCSACQLLETQRFKQAFACLNVAFERLKDLLKDPDPTLFIYVYLLTIRFPEAVRQQMLAYTAEMAAILLPANHPMRHIWLRLSQTASDQQLLDYASIILRSYFDLLGQSFSQRELGFVKFMRVFYNLASQHGYVNSEVVISKYNDNLKFVAGLGGCEEEVLQIKMGLAQILASSRRYEAADEFLDDVWREIHQPGAKFSLNILGSYYTRCFMMNQVRGRIEDAIVDGRRCLMVFEKQFGATNDTTTAFICKLQRYCVEVGHADESNLLQEILESRIELRTYLHEMGMIDEEDCKLEILD